MENVREVFEKYGKNASYIKVVGDIVQNSCKAKDFFAIPIIDIVDDYMHNSSDQLQGLEEWGVVSYNEDGDMYFVKREFSKNRYIEISSDQNKGLYLAYIDFGNDKFDIVLCDKVVF